MTYYNIQNALLNVYSTNIAAVNKLRFTHNNYAHMAVAFAVFMCISKAYHGLAINYGQNELNIFM